MKELVFADGIGSITVVGSTVRVDLVILEPQTDGASGRSKPVLSQRLIMPIDGFLAAARHITEAAEAIKKIDPRPAGAEPAVSNAPAEKAGELVAVRAVALPDSEPHNTPPHQRHFP